MLSALVALAAGPSADAAGRVRFPAEVHVTSSHFPQFDRNPNTGAAFGTTKQVRVAQQTVYHDAERPGDSAAVEMRRARRIPRPQCGGAKCQRFWPSPFGSM